MVLNSSDYQNSIVAGDDDAGFYADPQGGGFGFNADPDVRSAVAAQNLSDSAREHFFPSPTVQH